MFRPLIRGFLGVILLGVFDIRWMLLFSVIPQLASLGVRSRLSTPGSRVEKLLTSCEISILMYVIGHETMNIACTATSFSYFFFSFSFCCFSSGFIPISSVSNSLSGSSGTNACASQDSLITPTAWGARPPALLEKLDELASRWYTNNRGERSPDIRK